MSEEEEGGVMEENNSEEREDVKEEEGGNILDDILNTKEEKFEDEETVKKDEEEDDENDLDLGDEDSPEGSTRKDGVGKGPESDFSDSEDEESKALLRDGRDSEMSFKVRYTRLSNPLNCLFLSRRNQKLTLGLNLEERTRRLLKRKKVSRRKVRMRKMAEQMRQMRRKMMVRGRARRKMERKRRREGRKRATTMQPSSITFSGRQGHYQMIEGSSYNS